jgi:acyl carrier protein
MNDLSMISTESNLPPKRSDATEIPLDRAAPTYVDRILSSLEYSIGQFHQHQQETLEVHKQYLSYQSQYAQTFLELMQQQNQLWANVQTAPQEIQVKTAVLESAERSMMKFQEHQANTLRVHEQYLNHQADYAKNFFLLTQQSYAQFLEGDYQYSDRSLPLLSLTRSEVITTEPITTKQIVTEPETNGNGHHDLAEVEPDNGNGHHPVSEVEPETNGNGHHPVAEVEASLSLESSNVAIAPAPEIDFAILSGTLLDVVSEKTGYPAEMLELDMDMEADLGIDSIKRVEIMGALQEEMPELPQPDLEDLGDLRTLSQIIEYLRDFDRSTSVESVAATQPDLKTTLLTIISEKTGYPLPSLNLEMNLKADLGIDLVKQRAIFDSLQEQIPDILPTEAELEISELDTIAQLLDYLKSDGAQETQKKTSLSPIPL